jgi:hypothetical protein
MANTLNLLRNGAVGFTGWLARTGLDLLRVMFTPEVENPTIAV